MITATRFLSSINTIQATFTTTIHFKKPIPQINKLKIYKKRRGGILYNYTLYVALKDQEEFNAAKSNPETFWREKSEALEWFKAPEKILTQDEHGIHHWFADGEMNTAYMALDYHVENGRADQTALIYDSPVTSTKKTYSYRELRDEVALCAGMLKNLGIKKGDRVIIYMPMIPEAAIAARDSVQFIQSSSVVLPPLNWQSELMMPHPR